MAKPTARTYQRVDLPMQSSPAAIPVVTLPFKPSMLPVAGMQVTSITVDIHPDGASWCTIEGYRSGVWTPMSLGREQGKPMVQADKLLPWAEALAVKSGLPLTMLQDPYIGKRTGAISRLMVWGIQSRTERALA